MPLPPHHPTPRGNNLHPRGRKNTASLNYLGPSRRTGVLRLPELLWGANLKGRDPRGGVDWKCTGTFLPLRKTQNPLSHV